MAPLKIRLEAFERTAGGARIALSPARALHRLGARLQVSLTPDREHVEALRASGLEPPEPVSGIALIDTGASRTGINTAAAKRLGLVSRLTTKVTSVLHEVEEAPVFLCGIAFPQWGEENPIEALAVGLNLAPPELVALIGRDVLAKCVFVYDGPAGSFSLSDEAGSDGEEVSGVGRG